MADTDEFWAFFNSAAAPNLALREKTFRKIFEYLDSQVGEVTIVETGCARQAGNWAGDGQSTVLFDRYITARDRYSKCYTVDISPVSVAECRKLVSSRVQVTQQDSVQYLGALTKELRGYNAINLLYLDSFDIDWIYWQPSAIHHLKELLAIRPVIDEFTLVVVDDCPQNINFRPEPDGRAVVIGAPSVGGKGRLVAEFASAVGAQMEFADYQAGWTGF